MPRYKLTIEYDGTKYYGWQRQDSLPTISQSIEIAINKFSGENPETFASGRTDAGVHAFAQVAHFDLISDKFSDFQITKAINFYLKNEDIIILSCEEVPIEFNARFSAIKRYYQYQILQRSSPSVIDKNRVWHIRKELDISLMQKAADLLIGKHDFSSFRAAECQAKSPIKTIESIHIDKKDDKIIIGISARSFLHHMVRNIVGTLKLIGHKEMTLEKFQEGFVAKNRELMGPTAPACGLYFMKVDY